MTANERKFLELELQMLFRRLQRNREKIPIEILKSAYRNGYEALLGEIRDKALCYMKEVIFAGTGGYYLKTEKEELFQKLNGIVNDPESKKRLQNALFIETDMRQVQKLAAELRVQVEPVVREYQKHAEGGE